MLPAYYQFTCAGHLHAGYLAIGPPAELCLRDCSVHTKLDRLNLNGGNMFLKGYFRAILGCALMVIASAAVKADDLAYVATINESFGTMDLNTGVFTTLGNSGQLLAGMAVQNSTLFASAYHTSTGAIFTVNTANGTPTSIGNSGVDIDDFGSTTSGLYALGTNFDLYSINPTTGAATLVGATGISSFGSWRSLSTNSNLLYFSNGTDLYTLNTSTGAATLVGSLGSSTELGAMLFEDGTLYGGENTPGLDVDTINPGTGAASVLVGVTGTTSSFYAIAPNPIPSSGPPAVPEPGSLTLLGSGLFGIAAWLRRRR